MLRYDIELATVLARVNITAADISFLDSTKVKFLLEQTVNEIRSF
jgi:hypothetical protein